MSTLSSILSVTAHVAVGAAVLVGRARTVRSDPARPREISIVMAPSNPIHGTDGNGGSTAPEPIHVVPPDLNSLPAPIAIANGVLKGLSPAFSPNLGFGNCETTTATDGLAEEHAEILSGPLPVYPELLRQAGVQGRVVLEATVDTTGRVVAPSILVILVTNPGFVAAARRALLATVFRPAMVGGKPVRMRVRIPYEFAIQNGTGPIR
jgi:TonB family protein